jgi:hypothetical protein
VKRGSPLHASACRTGVVNRTPVRNFGRDQRSVLMKDYDVYTRVTNRIVELLKQGDIPTARCNARSVRAEHNAINAGRMPLEGNQ